MDHLDDKTDEPSPAEQGGIITYSSICLFRSLPFQFVVPIPFSRTSLRFGHQTLKSLRRKVQLDPDEADAHITLAAHLLSENPMTPSLAEEAARELRVALALLPTDPADPGYEDQKLAMVHDFLGDAYLELDRLEDARRHWRKAIKLDPVEPPWGFSGRAAEQLRKHGGAEEGKADES
jgi:tetratricopeptide (TPR) repeat protein